MSKAIEPDLSDQNDLAIGRQALDVFVDSGLRTYSLKQIKEENDL